MKVMKVWLLAGLTAAAVLGVLWATDVLVGDDLARAARMTLTAILILGLAHYAWTVIRGHGPGPDRTDKPVP